MEDTNITPSSAQKQTDSLVMEERKRAKIKGFLKKRRYLIAGSVLVVLIAIVALASSGKQPSYTTTEVTRGDLWQTVEASGDLESLENVDLSFQTSGVISAIYADVGSEVKAGDLIVALASTEALADLSAAQEQVNKAQAAIDKLYAGSSTEEIAISAASLKAAQVDLENSKITGQNSIDSAELNYQTAQDSYNNLVAQNDESLNEIYVDLITIMRSNVIEIRSALSDADDILGIENTLANNDFEMYLGANDPQTYASAKRYYGYASEGRDEAEAAVYAIDETYTYDDVLMVADAVSSALDYTTMTLYYTRAMLDATIIDTVDLSSSDIAAFKTSIDAARSSIQTGETSLIGEIQLLNSTLLSVTTNETSSANALESARLAYEGARSTYDATIAAKEAALASVQANHDKVIASVRSVDAALYYADLGIALANLNAASARFEKTEIRSPIDGVITNVVLDAGELAAAGTTIATVQTLDEAYKIELAVSESDIVKVGEGDSATVTFDAYGDDLEVEAYVGSIDPAETQIEGVTYYLVDIYISDTRSIALKPGMSADVTINTDSATDVLYIPQRAILENESGKYVRILTGKDYEERQILTGLRADGGLIEIIEGVQEGETVIISIQE